MLIYTEEVYNSLYSMTTSDGRTVSYGREYFEIVGIHRLQEQHLRSLGLTLTDRVIIVGCGFSPLLSLTPETIGTDPSPFVHANKRTEVERPWVIRPYAVPDRRLPRKFDWVIDDDVLPGLSDDEIEEFVAGCDELGARVIHYVSVLQEGVNQDSRLNWKTLEDWQSYAPNHMWHDFDFGRKPVIL